MLYLGIDIGKRNHVASMISSNKSIVFKAFKFANTTEGAESLIEKIYASNPENLPVEVGLEATGHYWLALYSFLCENSFSVHVINPIQTDGWRKGTEIRKRKTDIIDSLLIADFIRYGDFAESHIADENTLSLRNLARFRSYLVDSISDLKRKTIAVLDQVFPEYETVFSNIFGQTSKEILKSFSSPVDFENITSEQLLKALDKIKFKQFAATKINELAKLSKSSFGVKFASDSFTFQLKLLIEQIDFVQNQVNEIESEIEELLTIINSPITTIPGIGNVTAAVILGELGDVARFTSPSKLVAYAGLDATISQSGDFESTNNRMSKRGSPYLRRAIFTSAGIAAFHDPVFSAYYQKKRSEGKHHLVAVGAVARKLCNVIHYVLKNNEPYKVMDNNN